MAAAASHRLARGAHAAARRRAPAVRHQHSQGQTDDGGRPTRLFGATPKGGVSVCRLPLPTRRLKRAFGTRCRVVRRAPSPAQRDDGGTRAKNSDVSHGVRCLSTESASKIVGAPTYLTGAFRSQGFSPSQRFDPFETSWLCFTPHPSPGFRASRAFSAQPAGASLDAACSLAVQVSSARQTEVRVAVEELRLQSLLRLSIRHPPWPEPWQAGALLAFPLFEACRTRLRDRSPPLTRFTLQRSAVHGRPFSGYAPGYDSRAWRRLGEPPQPP